MNSNKYILAQYSFDDGESFYYVNNTYEMIDYLNKFEEKDNNNRFFILKNKEFSEDIVNIIINNSGLNELNCNCWFYKCDTIQDLNKNHLILE